MIVDITTIDIDDNSKGGADSAFTFSFLLRKANSQVCL